MCRVKVRPLARQVPPTARGSPGRAQRIQLLVQVGAQPGRSLSRVGSLVVCSGLLLLHHFQAGSCKKVVHLLIGVIAKSYYLFRYLQKATQLDRMLGPAWLAYGHSFAIENEHDQAMAAYFKVGPSPSVTSVLNLSCQACQLMRGCHLPLLYIGLEYSLTNNQQYAERFFSQVIAASQGKKRSQKFRSCSLEPINFLRLWRLLLTILLCFTSLG